jgi:hypothetical protein
MQDKDNPYPSDLSISLTLFGTEGEREEKFIEAVDLAPASSLQMVHIVRLFFIY